MEKLCDKKPSHIGKEDDSGLRSHKLSIASWLIIRAWEESCYMFKSAEQSRVPVAQLQAMCG